MMKRTLASAAAMLVCLGMFACEKADGPNSPAETDDTQTFEGSFDVTSQDGQTNLLKSAGVNIDSANAFFVLRWSQRIDRFMTGDTVMGHASAVAYEQPATLRDRNAVGLDMGAVSVIVGPDTFDLSKFVKHFSGVRYGMFGGPVGTKFRCGGFDGPRGNHGWHRGWSGPRGRHLGHAGNPLTIVNLPFVGGSTYQFDVTGADTIPAFSLSIQAPSQLVQITSLADWDSIDATQDLTVSWEGDPAANSTVLVLSPIKRKHHGQGQSVQSTFIRVDAAPSSYTIPAQTLQDLLTASSAKAISLHLSQSNVNEIADPQLGKTLVSAGSDDRVILLVK